MELECVEGRNVPSYQLDTNSLDDPCTYKVIMESSHACPVISLWELWYFMEDYDYLFGLMCLALGGYFISVGGLYFKATLFISAQFAFAFALLITLFGTVYPSYSPEWVMWINLIVVFSVGAGLGYAAMRWPFFGVLVLATILGCGLGAFIYSLGFYDFSSDHEHPNVVLWCTMATTGVITAFLFLIFFDYTVIIFSAVAGSYIFIRGFSIFTGEYPNEFLMFE